MSHSTPRFREKREAILDAAARLFNQHGIKGGTLSDVAGSVGLITNSITYYYRKKEDLVSACLMRSIESINEVTATAQQHADVSQRVRAFLIGNVSMLAEIENGRRPELVRFNDVRALTAPHVDAVFEAYTDMYRRIRNLLKPAGEAACLASGRTELNARAHLLLSLATWSRAWIDRYEPGDYARIGDWIADIVVNGIAANGVSWDVPAAARSCPRIRIGAAATPEAFLVAATRLVNEQGYRGASVERISGLLNLTKGAFYHHHETKGDLVCACFERTFAVIREAQRMAAGHSGNGWDKLVLATRSLVRHQLSEDGPLLRVSAWSALPPALRTEKLRTITRLGEGFAGFIVEGMVDGSIRPLDQSVAGHLVNGMINAAAEIERWVPGVCVDNAHDLFARPLLMGFARH